MDIVSIYCIVGLSLALTRGYFKIYEFISWAKGLKSSKSLDELKALSNSFFDEDDGGTNDLLSRALFAALITIGFSIFIVFSFSAWPVVFWLYLRKNIPAAK